MTTVSGFRRILIGLLAMFACLAPAKAQEQVDVALVLAVDVSRSMSFDELLIQRKGYAAAIASPDVIRAIQMGAYGRIAVTFFEWAADTHAREVLGWTLIETRADAEAVAARLLEDRSIGERRTSISGAIAHAVGMLQEVPFQADRLVIDISGDGPNNQGRPVAAARDEALAAGITINGLPLMTSGGYGSRFNIENLDLYYKDCVIGGPASFVIPVNDWEQFPEAVRRKLILEIGFVPPAELPVVRAQFNFRKPYDCLIGEKIWQQRQEMFWDDR